MKLVIQIKAFEFFMSTGLAVSFAGFVFGARFFYYYLTDGGAGHIQSLIYASILLGVGFQTMLTAFLADLLAVNRRLMEDVQYRVKKTGVSPEGLNFNSTATDTRQE